MGFSLFLRADATTSVGCKYLNKSCPGKKGRLCRGKIKDTILDWEHNLPEEELSMAEWHSNLADLSIALGTTMQIVPSGNLPVLAKKRGGRLVICNLQPTKQDKKADLIINTQVDRVMEGLLRLLDLQVDMYEHALDPTKRAVNQSVPWDFSKMTLKMTKSLYLDICTKLTKRKKGKEKTQENEADDEKKIKIEEVIPAEVPEICLEIKKELPTN